MSPLLPLMGLKEFTLNSRFNTRVPLIAVVRKSLAQETFV